MTPVIPRADRLFTERLLMRRARPGDLDAIHAIMSDPETMRYWSSPPHATPEESEAWFAAMLAAPEGDSDDFLLEHDGQVIGKMGAWRLPEVGYYIRRDHWGRGFAAEALAAFIPYIAARGALFLTADVDPLNTASLRLLARAGFHETGRAAATYVIGDRVCDSVYLRRDLQPV